MSSIKAVFKIFKSEKHGETLEIFFFMDSLPFIDSLAIGLIKRTIPLPHYLMTLLTQLDSSHLFHPVGHYTRLVTP
jgi:hypothetical protein